MASGRQREFDRDKALEAAMYVFWKKGYIGASLTELCRAMGINKPSMYAAFGNKEALFVAATDNYIQVYVKPSLKHLDGESTLALRLNRYLSAIVLEQCTNEKSCGCYLSISLSESGSDVLPGEAMLKVEQARDFTERYFCDFYEREKIKGSFTEDVDIAVQTGLTMAFMHGTASLARGGVSFDKLQPLIDEFIARMPVDKEGA